MQAQKNVKVIRKDALLSHASHVHTNGSQLPKHLLSTTNHRLLLLRICNPLNLLRSHALTDSRNKSRVNKIHISTTISTNPITQIKVVAVVAALTDVLQKTVKMRIKADVRSSVIKKRMPMITVLVVALTERTLREVSEVGITTVGPQEDAHINRDTGVTVEDIMADQARATRAHT